jgi:hypothetical protein
MEYRPLRAERDAHDPKVNRNAAADLSDFRAVTGLADAGRDDASTWQTLAAGGRLPVVLLDCTVLKIREGVSVHCRLATWVGPVRGNGITTQEREKIRKLRRERF